MFATSETAFSSDKVCVEKTRRELQKVAVNASRVHFASLSQTGENARRSPHAISMFSKMANHSFALRIAQSDRDRTFSQECLVLQEEERIIHKISRVAEDDGEMENNISHPVEIVFFEKASNFVTNDENVERKYSSTLHDIFSSLQSILWNFCEETKSCPDERMAPIRVFEESSGTCNKIIREKGCEGRSEEMEAVEFVVACDISRTERNEEWLDISRF